MLQISRQQMNALTEATLASFLSRMITYLHEEFPDTCAMKDDDLRSRIREGVDRAVSCGAISERAVCQYIDIMFRLGFQFDRDPNHEWAGRLLRIDSQDIDRTIAYLHEIAVQKKVK